MSPQSPKPSTVKEDRVEVLLFELFGEFVQTNDFLMQALDHLDKLEHPFADTRDPATRDKWLWRHVKAAATYEAVAQKLHELGFVLPQ
jgi:hypothetical protein